MSLLQGLAQSIGTADHELHVSGLTYSDGDGGNIFFGQLPQSPDEAILLETFGGPESDSGLPFDTVAVQIMVRGTQDPTAAQDLWYSIYSVLHGAVQSVLQDGSYMISCLVDQPSPVPIGPDENGRYRYTMNLRAEWVNATDNRSAPI